MADVICIYGGYAMRIEYIRICHFKSIQNLEIDNIEKLIEQTSTLIFNDSKLSDSIYSDILSFINDEKDAESTAKSIQKKVTYYMNEGK